MIKKVKKIKRKSSGTTKYAELWSFSIVHNGIIKMEFPVKIKRKTMEQFYIRNDTLQHENKNSSSGSVGWGAG